MSSNLLLKRLGTESLIYGMSGMLTRFVAVFLTPIYTRIFAPSDYGSLSLVTTLFALLSILLVLSLDNSAARWFYDTDDEQDRRKTLNTFLWSCLGASLILAVSVFIFADFIAENIFRAPDTASLLPLMAANLPLSVFSVFVTTVLRMRRKAAATGVFTVTTSLLNVGLNVLFVVYLETGLPGIFYAQILTSAVAVVWAIVLFRKEISPFLFDGKRWAEMFFFSMPLIPGTLAFWVINMSGAYFIQLFDKTHEVGLYQIGVNVASMAALVGGAFQMAWGPFAYSIHKQPDAGKVYAQVLLVFIAITGSLSLGVMLFAPEILVVLTQPAYYDAAFVAGLLAFNHVMIGVGFIANIGPGIAKNNKAYGMAMLISAGVLVGLNFLLIPRFGKEGAAVSILISQSIIPIAVFAHGQRIYPIPYKFAKAGLIFLLALSMGISSVFILSSGQFHLPVAFGIKSLVLGAFAAIVYLLLKDEIKRSDLASV